MDINLKKVINALQYENKPVWLFASLRMDEFIDKWSIMVSAPWITDGNRKEMFEYILKLLKENLDPKELSSIARLGLLPKTDHLIEELLKRNSTESLKDTPVNGNVIHEGYILVCDPNLEWKEDTTLFPKVTNGESK